MRLWPALLIAIISGGSASASNYDYYDEGIALGHAYRRDCVGTGIACSRVADRILLAVDANEDYRLIDADGDTSVTVESAPGTDEDIISFITPGGPETYIDDDKLFLGDWTVSERTIEWLCALGTQCVISTPAQDFDMNQALEIGSPSLATTHLGFGVSGVDGSLAYISTYQTYTLHGDYDSNHSLEVYGINRNLDGDGFYQVLQLGPDPTDGESPAGSFDTMVVSKTSIVNNPSRTIQVFHQVGGQSGTNTRVNWGINAFSDVNSDTTANFTHAVTGVGGGRMQMRHKGSGTVDIGTGFTAAAKIQGNEDGIVSHAYALLSEIADGGGAGVGYLDEYSAVGVWDTAGPVNVQYGLLLEGDTSKGGFSNADEFYGVYCAELANPTDSRCLWLDTADAYDKAQGIGWGSDRSLNLWQEADDVLAIDGSLHMHTDFELDGVLNHDGGSIGFFGTTPASQASAYTLTPTVVTSYTLNANASATAANNNAVLAQLITDLQAYGLLQ